MTDQAATSRQVEKKPGGAAFAIELEKINKSFGAVHANRDINLSIPKGSIHGIIGRTAPANPP